jgi:hypothetical protein
MQNEYLSHQTYDWGEAGNMSIEKYITLFLLIIRKFIRM